MGVLGSDYVLRLHPRWLTSVKTIKSNQMEREKTISENKHEIAYKFDSLEKKVAQFTDLSNPSAEM